MANTKGSALPAMTTPVGSDIFVVVDDPGGTPATQKVTFANAWTNYFRGQADGRYLEVAGSGEISIITAKTTPADGDFLLIEDSAAANVKKSLTVLNLWENSLKGKADALYFAKATAAEISALTEKASPIGADHVLIEDSAAGNAKKRTTITNLLTGSGVAGELSTKFSTDTKTIPAATNDYFMMVDPDNASAGLKEHGVKIEDMWANRLKSDAETAFQRSASASSSAGTLTLAFGSGPNFNTTLTENITTLTITGWPASGTEGKIRLRLTQDATGGRTFTFTSILWPGGTAPTVTSAANAVDIFVITSDDGGTTKYGHLVGQNYS